MNSKTLIPESNLENTKNVENSYVPQWDGPARAKLKKIKIKINKCNWLCR